MVKDDRSYHLKLQEFCDCFMETDFKKELEKACKGVSGAPNADQDELPLKFLGVAMLYGANEEARKISLQKSRDGKVLFSVEARGRYQLPAPGSALTDRIFYLARSLAHVDKDQEKIPLSLGLRNDRMELMLEFDRGNGEESFTINFPK